MIAQCKKCGNYDWDKTVEENRIICPKCGSVHTFKKLPLFILTGCSGVGKTTTAQHLINMNIGAVVLDADFFYNMLPHESESDYLNQTEKLEDLSKNIMQCGLPVLWTRAGNLDMLNKVYNRRFFSDIYCLALVCSESELRRRMEEGRGITDKNWIDGSVAYNNYFKTHSTIGDTAFEALDIDGMAPEEAASAVIKWFNTKMERVE